MTTSFNPKLGRIEIANEVVLFWVTLEDQNHFSVGMVVPGDRQMWLAGESLDQLTSDSDKKEFIIEKLEIATRSTLKPRTLFEWTPEKEEEILAFLITAVEQQVLSQGDTK